MVQVITHEGIQLARLSVSVILAADVHDIKKLDAGLAIGECTLWLRDIVRLMCSAS